MLLANPKLSVGPLTVQTVYYGKSANTVLQVNLAKHPNRAILHAVQHLMMNDYSAFVAEITDLEFGELHCVLTRDVQGTIRIVFKRDPTAPRCIR